MKYDFIMTEEDYLKFNVESYKNSHAYKVMNKITYAALAVVTAFLVVIFFYFSIKNGMPIYVSIFETVFLLIFCGIYLFFKFRPKSRNKSAVRVCKRALKMLEKDGKLPYSKHYTVEFSDDEYVETTENSVSHTKYSNVNKVIYADDAMYLFVDAQQATVILYSCLGEDKQKIIDFIKQKVK